MCGRYASSASQDRLTQVFEVDEVASAADPTVLRPRWNIAPTDAVPAVVERLPKDAGQAGSGTPVRKLVTPTWGLVPSWSKDPASGARMINARAETVAEKPAFRKAFATRRCLVPADGYYEWYPLTEPDGTPVKRNGRQVKQPFFIQPGPASVAMARQDAGAPGADGQDPLPGMMAMAGIYEFWRNRELPPDHPDAWLTTCAIITTSASDALGHIHDRMPVQVAPKDWAAWLDPHLTDPREALSLMHVPAGDEMVAHAVSLAVNRVGTDGPELVEPLPMVEESVGGAVLEHGAGRQ